MGQDIDHGDIKGIHFLGANNIALLSHIENGYFFSINSANFVIKAKNNVYKIQVVCYDKNIKKFNGGATSCV